MQLSPNHAAEHDTAHVDTLHTLSHTNKDGDIEGVCVCI